MQELSSETTQNITVWTRMILELGWKSLENRRKHISLTMLYKIINDIANVPNKEILIPADTRTRSKHEHNFA